MLGSMLMAYDYDSAHEHCRKNREELLASELCGCFYCFETFGPDKITRWNRCSLPLLSNRFCYRLTLRLPNQRGVPSRDARALVPSDNELGGSGKALAKY
jgi:hypothetical protein